jgi:hypothetical protein
LKPTSGQRAAEIGAGEGIRTLDPNLGNALSPLTLQHLPLSQTPLGTIKDRLAIHLLQSFSIFDEIGIAA